MDPMHPMHPVWPVWPVHAMNVVCGNQNVTDFGLVKPAKQQIDVNCTYSLPSGNHANSWTRIKILEERLRRARAYLNQAQKSAPSLAAVNFDVLLGVVDDCMPSRIKEAERSEDSDEAENLHSMMDSYGRVAMNHDTRPTNDFYGASSGLAFIQRTRGYFEESTDDGTGPGKCTVKHATVVQLFDAPLPEEHTVHAGLPSAGPLPPWKVATKLLDNVLSRIGPFSNFIDENAFRESARRLYKLELTPYESEDRSFLPFFHAVIGLGYLFSPTQHEERGCHQAAVQGLRHFMAAQNMVDITRVRDLVSLQTLICCILFLVSSARIASAHGYLALAVSSAMRQGLPFRTADDSAYSMKERDARYRTLCAVVNLDMYVATVLGLPPLIELSGANPAIDTSIQHALDNVKRKDNLPHLDAVLQAAAAKHIDLLKIIRRTNQALFPQSLDGSQTKCGKPAISVKVSKLQQLEHEFRKWTASISEVFTSADNREAVARMRYEIEMSYCFGQIILYRAFLHYLTKPDETAPSRKRQLQYALRCVKASSQAISISLIQQQRGLLCPASWPSAYTVFLSLICLTFALGTRKNDLNIEVSRKEIEVGARLLAHATCPTDTGSRPNLETLQAFIKHVSCAVDVNIDDICETTQPCCVADFDCSETSEQSDADQLQESGHSPSQTMATMSNTYPSSILCEFPFEVDQNLSFLSGVAGAHTMPGTGYVGSSAYLEDPYVGHQLSSLFVQQSDEETMEIPYKQRFSWPLQRASTAQSPQRNEAAPPSSELSSDDITAFMTIGQGGQWWP